MNFIKATVTLCASAMFAAACNTSTVDTPAPAAGTRPATATTSPTAMPAAAPSPAPDEFAEARATFNAACARCHQVSGEGGMADFGNGAKLTVPSFKEVRTLSDTDEKFTLQIANGGNGMPAFKSRLTPEQIDGLVRFIRQEFQAGLIKESSTPAPAGGQ
ncbi:MAG: cytochrome c [Pyrinomonadaceae bacterium]|nr:cytochrome c [Pyrinomonadaceae bacterium]